MVLPLIAFAALSIGTALIGPVYNEIKEKQIEQQQKEQLSTKPSFERLIDFKVDVADNNVNVMPYVLGGLAVGAAYYMIRR